MHAFISGMDCQGECRHGPPNNPQKGKGDGPLSFPPHAGYFTLVHKMES